MAWNGSSNDMPKAVGTKKSPAVGRGLFAGGVVVLLAGAVAYFMFSKKVAVPDEEPESTRPRVLSTAKPAKPKQEEPKPSAEDEARKKAAKARREMLAKMTPEERFNFLLEEAKNKPIDLTPSTNQAFRTGTEQVLSWIFTARVGSPPPPLPP